MPHRKRIHLHRRQSHGDECPRHFPLFVLVTDRDELSGARAATFPGPAIVTAHKNRSREHKALLSVGRAGKLVSIMVTKGAAEAPEVEQFLARRENGTPFCHRLIDAGAA